MENINDYKALAFFDLDGTLLNSQSKLDQEVIEGIHRIRKMVSCLLLPLVVVTLNWMKLWLQQELLELLL